MSDLLSLLAGTFYLDAHSENVKDSPHFEHAQILFGDTILYRPYTHTALFP